MTNANVRFYAGSAEVAGTQSTSVELPDGATVADLVVVLGSTNEALAEVLKVCTLLVDAKPAALTDPLPAGAAAIDVLPPFAGG